jgi:pimeloyl-ACP methyl ester carboxylesterase
MKKEEEKNSNIDNFLDTIEENIDLSKKFTEENKNDINIEKLIEKDFILIDTDNFKRNEKNEDLVMIHGLDSTKETFQRPAKELEEKYNIYTPDLRYL